MKPIRLFLVPLAILGLAISSQAQTVDDYIDLIDACHLGDLEEVKAGLAKGIDINQPDGDKLTPLMHALSAKQKDVVRYLIDRGADVTLDSEYADALFYAVKSTEKEIVELMLKKGARPEGGKTGLNSIEGVLTVGDLEMLKLLQKHGARLGREAIYTAAHNRNVDIVQYLLEAGADPDALSSDGVSLLGIAAWSNYPELVQLALKHGADPNLINREIVLNRDSSAEHSYGSPHTVLSAAVHMNHLKIVGILLQAGADPKLLDNQAIKYADLVGDQRIYDLLVEYGAEEQNPYAFLNLDFRKPPGLREKPSQPIFNIFQSKSHYKWALGAARLRPVALHLSDFV